MAWDEEIWRGRFQGYTSFALLDWIEKDPASYTAKIASEVLNQRITDKLVAAGQEPERYRRKG